MHLLYYILLPFIVTMIDLENKISKKQVVYMRYMAQPIRDSELNKIKEAITLKNTLKNIKKNKHKGLKPFQFPTGVIWAINKENAQRKYEKLLNKN